MSDGKAIGGYFELELPGRPQHYHDTPHRLKNGRAALHYILQHVQPSLVWVPYYTCDSLLEPFIQNGYQYRFYEIDEKLEPRMLPELGAGEYFLYVNYFGIKGEATALLSERYGDKLIIDATQAFYMKGNGTSWLFNSCRKFFGVPDGAYLYTPSGVALPVVSKRNERYETEHLLKRYEGNVQEGYKYFQQNEALMDCEIAAMSRLSEGLLSTIDYYAAADARSANYLAMWHELKDWNQLNTMTSYKDVPMCYPMLPKNKVDRASLHANNIFIPTYWSEVVSRSAEGYATEKRLADMLLPIPTDQRYGPDDIDYLITALPEFAL